MRLRFLFLLDAVIRLNSADANCPGLRGGQRGPALPGGTVLYLDVFLPPALVCVSGLDFDSL